MKKTWLLVVGFVLFVLGITSLVMMLVGVRWAFLTFIDSAGGLFGFVVRLLMIVGGVICVVFANTDWEKERRESE